MLIRCRRTFARTPVLAADRQFLLGKAWVALTILPPEECPDWAGDLRDFGMLDNSVVFRRH